MAVYLLLLLALAVTITFHPKPPKEKEALEMDLSMLELPKKQPKPPKSFSEQKKSQKTRPKQQIEKPYTPEKQPKPEPKPEPQPQKTPEQPSFEPKETPKPKKREKTPQLKKEGGELLVQKEQNSTKTMKMPSLSQIGQALSKQQSKQKKQKQLNEAQRYLQNLYGKEYDELSKEQKQFLGTNLKSIGSVTQRHLNILGYPRIAIITRQNGTNIVEFTLYPSGDISGLKLIESSGYSALDDHSIELIEVAHKDYPRPQSPTTVRIKVIYNAFSQ